MKREMRDKWKYGGEQNWEAIYSSNWFSANEFKSRCHTQNYSEMDRPIKYVMEFQI